MVTKDERLILLDADVISHFIKGGQFALLPSIFSNKKVLLDVVANELKATRKFAVYIDNVIRTGFIKEISFCGSKEMMMEYSRLIKTCGKGESACMAYCKFNKDILASSNLKDTAKYCEENGIAYITTMDFLAEALKSNQLTEQQCDDFIRNVKAAGSKLPVDSLAEYIRNYGVRSI
jgi:hypothetical protein